MAPRGGAIVVFLREKRKKKKEKNIIFPNFAYLFLTNFSDGHDGHNLDNAAHVYTSWILQKYKNTKQKYPGTIVYSYDSKTKTDPVQ